MNENRRYITRTPYPGNIEMLGEYDPETDTVTVKSLLRSPQPWEEYQQDNPGHRALTWDQLYPEIQAHEQARTTDPQEITESEWWEMFEVLPPQRYMHVSGFEVFHCLERLSGSLCAWYAAKDGKHYTWTDFDHISREEIANRLGRIEA